MKARIPTRIFRIATQGILLGLWTALIIATRHPIETGIIRFIPASFFLRIDPLVMTTVIGSTRILVTITLLGLVTLGVTFIMGRVFCGWVCPLGSLFDIYGWILRRLKVHTGGPSPTWFRAKYYLLAAITVLSLTGATTLLMGFDPIVLLTRLAATVIYPNFRASDDLHLMSGAPMGIRGAFVDALTLLIFLAIIAATTRLSRIWCRAACPLGAYLALASRHSALRRETRDCIQCGICAQHCPTGAIDFKDATVYNESECIKCFACSQECPVDANFFTWKNPLPSVTPSYAPVSLDRRTVLTTSAAALLAVPTVSLSSGLPGSSKKLIRPPVSREERDFLSSCIRCGECMKACPTGVLKPAGFEHGLRALWTPVMTPTEGYCKPECNACSVACPTDAIMKYPLAEKYTYKAGTAVFDSSRCISYTENKFCMECVRACPTNAISVKKDWTPETQGAAGSEQPAPEGRVPTRPTAVLFDQCIGCGACEFECNQIVAAAPAMVTTSFGRAIPSKNIQPRSETGDAS